MADSHALTTLHGRCHCGRLRVEFGTGQAPAKIVPRACDCSFCRKHGAAYVSDPPDAFDPARGAHAMREYRQGSDTARFLMCSDCGVWSRSFSNRSRLTARRMRPASDAGDTSTRGSASVAAMARPATEGCAPGGYSLGCRSPTEHNVEADHGLGYARLTDHHEPDSANTGHGCSCHGPSWTTPNQRSAPMRPVVGRPPPAGSRSAGGRDRRAFEYLTLS